jgi:hypothetical protein
MEVAAAEIKMQSGIAFVVLEKTLWVTTNRFSAPWWLTEVDFIIGQQTNLI